MSHAKQRHTPRSFDDSREIIHRRGLPGHVTTAVRQHGHHAVLTTVQSGMEQALEEACNASLGGVRSDHLPWGRGPERTRRGSDRRELCTPYGGMPDLRVPKRRRGTGDVSGQTIARDDRGWGPLRAQQVMGDGLGRRWRALHASRRLTLGAVLSVSSCHRLGLGLAPPMAACKTTPLAAPPPIRLVDGMWVTIAEPPGERRDDAPGRRRAVKRQQQRGGLSALGVGPEGHGESVHWQGASGENQPAWEAFCKERAAQGMTAQTTALVASDGAQGLENALGEQRQGVPHQRCRFHTSKHIADPLVCDDLEVEGSLDAPPAVRTAKQARTHAMVADAGRLDAGAVAADLRAQAAACRAPWEGREPQAVAHCCTDFAKPFSSVQGDFPTSLAPRIRTTNLLERWHREVRRKPYDMGMLQSERGGEVLGYLLSMRESAKRQAALKSRS